MSTLANFPDWTDEEYANFGLTTQVGQHDYHALPLFEDSALIALLDNYPRRWLQAFTMGEDPVKRDQWKCVDIAPSSSGADLWRAVQVGRLWFNLTHIEEHSQEYADLINRMYENIGKRCPHLENPTANYSTLLISSPTAQVYYHVDAEPNMLWHFRGKKRVWIYPAMDTRFTPQAYLEDIYAGEVDENIPYKADFDQFAESCVLSPGDVASWPHNGPHRIVNQESVNVSLATSYYTPRIYRRQYVQLANRFLLRGIGVRSRSMDEQGLMPSLKRFSYRVINKIKPFKRINRSATYVTDLQVDPDSALGIRQLDSAQAASFSVLQAS